jgi:inosine-uridine nucleoside N-ribohydrolase
VTTDSRRYALIDTDPGIDDALALLLAWGSPEWTVETVTVVAGNVSMQAGTLNVLRLLRLRRPSPPPVVASGAAAPLARPLHTAPYHGMDGLGDLLDWPPVESRVVSTDAPGVIVDAARHRGRSLTIVALGPMTNLALAVERDGVALRGVGRVVAMGGAVDVPGNVTPDAEFNAYVDPEALARMLDAGVRVDLVPLDATRQAVLERAALHATLARTPGALADGVRRFTEYALRLDEKHGRRGMALHDPLAIGVALDPSLVEWEPVRLTIGPDGQTRRTPGEPNVRFARVVDTPRFLRLFLDRLCGGLLAS